VDGYRVVVFLHLVALAVLVCAIALVAVSYVRLRAARSRDEATPWATLADQVTVLFPVAILGLLASGAYLTSDRWSWSTPWIDVSIVALVLVAAQGPLVAGRTTADLARVVREHEQGPLGEDVRRLARTPALWFVVCGNPAIVLAIVWNMTVKPGTAGAIAAVVVGYAVGVGAALLAGGVSPVRASRRSGG
jgi:hypothetical protein